MPFYNDFIDKFEKRLNYEASKASKASLEGSLAENQTLADAMAEAETTWQQSRELSEEESKATYDLLDAKTQILNLITELSPKNKRQALDDLIWKLGDIIATNKSSEDASDQLSQNPPKRVFLTWLPASLLNQVYDLESKVNNANETLRTSREAAIEEFQTNFKKQWIAKHTQNTNVAEKIVKDFLTKGWVQDRFGLQCGIFTLRDCHFYILLSELQPENNATNDPAVLTELEQQYEQLQAYYENRPSNPHKNHRIMSYILSLREKLLIRISTPNSTSPSLNEIKLAKNAASKLKELYKSENYKKYGDLFDERKSQITAEKIMYPENYHSHGGTEYRNYDNSPNFQKITESKIEKINRYLDPCLNFIDNIKKITTKKNYEMKENTTTTLYETRKDKKQIALTQLTKFANTTDPAAALKDIEDYLISDSADIEALKYTNKQGREFSDVYEEVVEYAHQMRIEIVNKNVQVQEKPGILEAERTRFHTMHKTSDSDFTLQ